MIIGGYYQPLIIILCTGILSSIAFFVSCKIYDKIYDKQVELEEQREFLAEFLDLTGPEPAEPPQEETEPPLEPGKVKCEYCDSVVDAGTNCPNCGAVLPRAPADSALDAVVRFGQAAHDWGVYMDSIQTASPLTQRR